MSQVSLDNVAQTPAKTINTDDVFEAVPTSDVQDDREVAPEDGQVKFVEDETHPIMEENELAKHNQVVEKEAPID